MATNPTGLPQRYLRTPEAARFVGLSIRTLEKHRIYGTGPRYSKLGGRVVYSFEDLQTWVESGAKMSTSDPGVATVLPAKRQSPLVSAANTQFVPSLTVFLPCRSTVARSSERDQPQLFRALPSNLAPAMTQGRAMIGAFPKQRCSRRADVLRACLDVNLLTPGYHHERADRHAHPCRTDLARKADRALDPIWPRCRRTDR